MSLDLSRNYQPPGVYIEESDSTLVSATGIPPTLVALVGPAQGYQTSIEQVPFATAGVRLTQQGIDTASIVVTVAATGATVDPGDYTTARSGGTVDSREFYVDLTPANGAVTVADTVVFVAYQYTNPLYYAPKSFESFEDVKDVYGEPLNTAIATPGDSTYQYVLSPLSLAAKVAFENGGTELWMVAAEPPPSAAISDSAKSTARRTNLAAAYAKLDSNSQVNVIVAITTGIADADATGALTDLHSSLEMAANDDFFRFGVIGFGPKITTAPTALLSTSGSSTRRMMFAYAGPSGLLMYSGAANTSFAVGHEYLAAAYAGRMAALPVQYALTKQVMRSFTGLAGTPLANSLKNSYSANGIAVAEVDRFGQLVVRHGVTTDTTNVNTREAAVVRAKDAMVTSLADGMSVSGLIGAPIDGNTLLSVKSAVSGILESAVSQEVILSYANLAVRQTSNDPSVIEVKFAYKPAYPLNYIVISFSIDTTTGTLALTDTAA